MEPNPPFRQTFNNAMDPLAAQNALRIGVIDSWTPTLTFASAGDLSVNYASRIGQLVSIGKLRFVTIAISATPTFSTASGDMQITGMPVTVVAGAPSVNGLCATFGGITKAGYSQLNSQLDPNGSTFTFVASAFGTAASAITAANVSSGVAVRIRTQVIFEST